MVHEPIYAATSFTLSTVPVKEHACSRGTYLITQQKGEICKSYFSVIETNHSNWSGEVNDNSAAAQVKTNFQIRNMSFDKSV